MIRILSPVLALVLLAVAPAGATDSHRSAPVVTKAWARATPAAIKIGAAYVEIMAGHEADRLIGASSAIADRVEIHTHKMDGDKMTMAKIDALDIPAGGSVKFAPGGHHFMLFDLRQQLKENEKLPLVLEFAKAGKVEVTADIVAIWSLGPDDKKADDHAQHQAGHNGEHGPDHKMHMEQEKHTEHEKHMEHDHSKHR